jgi:ubiquinone/menaquinone biosynthesis C-methylase UbiE
MKLGRMEKWFMNRPKHARRVINRVERLLPFACPEEGQRFLEVGCGSGAVCRHMAKRHSLNVTGTDVDGEQIERAQKDIDNAANLRFLEADATNLPFQDKDFDIVLSFQVLHHISNWLDALEEIRRILRPEGYFICVDTVYPRWTAGFGRMFRHKYGITTLPALDSFIEKSGLSTIHSSLSKLLLFHQYEAVYRSN